MTRPPSALLHPRPHQPGQPDGREELEVEVRLQHVIGEALEGSDLRRSRIVHEDIDLAEPALDVPQGPFDVGRDRNVAHEGRHSPVADRARRRGEAVFVAPQDRNIRAGRGEPCRDRKPDPPTAACDDRAPARPMRLPRPACSLAEPRSEPWHDTPTRHAT